MKIDLKNYLDERTIILDEFETYPDFVKNIFKANIDIIKAYFVEDEKIYLENVKQSYFPTENRNKYFQQYKYIARVVAEELVEKECKFLGFHATRLLDEEIEDIKCNGLKLFTLEEHFKKLNNLLRCGFDKNEIKILKKYSYIENGNRKQRIYFSSSKNVVNNEVWLNDLFGIWGGEITFWQKKKFSKEIFDKLRKVGFPCVVLVKLNICNYMLLEELVKSLMGHYLLKTKINSSDVSVCNKNFELIDVLKFDRNNGDLFV